MFLINVNSKVGIAIVMPIVVTFTIFITGFITGSAYRNLNMVPPGTGTGTYWYNNTLVDE